MAGGRRPRRRKTQRGLGQDHGRYGDGHADDQVAHEARHQVPHDDGELLDPGHLGGHGVVLLAQGQYLAAHHPRQAGPADERQDDGHAEVDADHGPVRGHGRGQRQPERNGGERAEDLDEALDERVDKAAVIARYAADDDSQDQAERYADQPDGKRRCGSRK